MFAREKTAGDNSRGGSSSLAVPRVSKFRRLLLAILVAIFIFFSLFRDQSATNEIEESILRYVSLSSEEQARLHNHQLAALRTGLEQCATIKAKPVSTTDVNRVNPRALQSAQPVLIKNATLIDGDGSILTGHSILLKDGVVKEVGLDVIGPENSKVIDVGGRYISPGLLDMVKIRV